MGFLTINVDSPVFDNIMEDITMPAIVKFPSVVEEALDRLGHNFPNEPERRHFAEYLTGLIIAHKKNVSAINREFASTTDQSCLNRWLTQADWTVPQQIPGDFVFDSYFTKSIRIPDVDHRVRLVILWDKKNDKEAKKMLVCNQTRWDVIRILKVYRCRWTGTECFHRDGKQQLGMGDCQLRNGRGQTRHMYMVFLAHSVLMRQLRQGRAYAWARERLMTIGQACMTVLRQTLSDTIEWVFERIEDDHWDVNRIKFQLVLP